MKRYFENRRHVPYLFWEITVCGPSLTERFGALGIRGQTQSILYPSNDAASRYGKYLIDKKQQEGYGELTPVPPPGPWYGRADADTENRFLDCLESVARDPSAPFFFNPPASARSITEMEIRCQITLPKSLRSFLMYHDGGFICPEKSVQDFEEAKATFDDLQRFPVNSICRLFSTKQIGTLFSVRGPGVIPFCHTYNGEVLTVWSMKHPHQDSPVFDAFHENPATKWTMLYPTFAHLFIEYVEKHGVIKTGWGDDVR